MKTIGLDIHSGKPSYLYTEEEGIEQYAPDDLLTFLREQIESDVPPLIVCDAPLTATYLYKYKCSFDDKNGLTKRGIEYFFTRKDYGFDVKPIQGISVGGYSELSHRTVVDYVFGLPNVENEAFLGGSDSTKKIPFLAAQPADYATTTGPALIETHPAVFLLLLLERSENIDWNYKKDNSAFDKLKLKLAEKIPSTLNNRDQHSKHLKSFTKDDELDAFLCWLAGKMYLDGSARIYGNELTGSFLLPWSEGLDVAFANLSECYEWPEND